MTAGGKTAGGKTAGEMAPMADGRSSSGEGACAVKVEGSLSTSGTTRATTGTKRSLVHDAEAANAEGDGVSARPSLSGTWSCAICTYDNTPDTTRCAICSTLEGVAGSVGSGGGGGGSGGSEAKRARVQSPRKSGTSSSATKSKGRSKSTGKSTGKGKGKGKGKATGTGKTMLPGQKTLGSFFGKSS